MIPTWGPTTGVNAVLNSADVYIPLTHSLVPDKTPVGAAPTYTRATTATVRDNEGVLRTAIAGEARFEGARRVRNLLTFTEDFSNAVWDKYQCTAPVNVVVGPTGRVTNTLTADANGGQHAVRQNVTVISGNTIIWSVYVKAGTASWVRLQCVSLANANCFFNISSGAVGTAAGCTGTIEDAGDGWYRCSIKGTTSATSGFNQVELADGDNDVNSVVSSGLTAYIGGAQLEDITGRTDQTTPSEYVSVGATPINLMLQSEMQTGWTANDTTAALNNTTAPNGTTTAARITVSATTAGHNFAYGAVVTPTGGTVYTQSVYVKPGTVRYISMRGISGGTWPWATLDTQTGAIQNNGAVTSSAATQDASGWWRLSVTYTASTSTIDSFVIAASNVATAPSTATAAGNSYLGAGETFYCWGAQLETGSTATTYIPTTTVAKAYNEYHGSGVDGVKAFNTALDGSLIPAATNTGYLAEGARTNATTYSQDMSNAAWTANATNVSIVADQYTAPDGSTTADKILASAGNAGHYIYNAAAVPNGASTLSVYLRYVNHRWVSLRIFSGAATNAHVSFDLLNGVVGSVGSGSATISPTALSGVYRCTITGTTTSTSGNVLISLNNTDTASIETWNAAGTEAVGAWGWQTELGSFASSYIPTTTAAVTRNADVLTYPSAGNIDGTVGWAYCEATWNATGSSSGFMDFDSAGNRGWFVTTTVANALEIYDGTTELKSPTVSVVQSTPAKVSMTFGGSIMNCSANGTNGTAVAFDGNMNAGSEFSVGKRGATTGDQALFGTIRNLRIGQRQLSASEMQAITA